MNARNVVFINLLCFGTAGILLLAALIPLANVPISIPWSGAMVIAAALSASVGAFLQRILLEQREAAEREHSEAEIARVQVEQQQTAVDTLSDGLDVALFICNERAEILYANRKALDMFQFPDPGGRSILAVTLSYDLQSLVSECFGTGHSQRAELKFSYPEERVGVCDAWLEPNGERLFLSIQDISDLKRLERIRQDFVSNVSHELRTPLASIRLMAETLEDEEDNKELSKRYLAKIVSEVDRLSLIANDLLILSAAESNPVRKHLCDIAEVVRSVGSQLAPKAKSKGLEVRYTGPQELKIEANAAQMSQVMLNLVDNAINYTVSGHVDIRLEKKGASAEIAVADTGVGIPSEHVSRIFERFYRVDKSRSRASGGTGLGLSIVKHIVESHGGTVKVESAQNQGSTFVVTLPIGDPSLEVSSA